ncbi:MAG: outer membrane protein transport protein [Pseudomonadota bacterium]
MRLSFKHAALAAACLAAFPAHATNGYFLPGFGIRSQGMGGVGIAYGRDSLSTAANPANAVNTGMRGDMGFAVFNPERHASISNDPGTPSFGFFTDTGYFDGNVESDAKYFLMPEMGFSMPLTDKLHVALAVVGNGGMNTTYRENIFSLNGTPPVDKTIGVDMMQLLVPISAAYKVNENHAVGASLVLAETRFRAYGLGAFQLFPVSSDPAHLTDQGFDYSYGAGVKLGWLGEFLDDKVAIGVTYASRTWMSKFDKYRGLFAEQGDFDIPENYGIGIAIKPVKNLVIAADVLRINYNDIASVGNRGPGVFSMPSLGIPALVDDGTDLGNDNGMGFGWKNQTVYKLGIQYGVNNRLQVRAGYNYGKTPIPDDQVTFNLLAPATVEKHYSVGLTYRANDNLEVTGSYMYVASNSQSACNQNIVDCASFNMHQNVWGLTLGWVLDPGPGALEEYGEDDWAGIDFTGLYGGLGIGQSNYRDIASTVDSDLGSLGLTSSTSANTRSEGWKVYAGYQFNKYFAVEGGFVNLNDFTASSTITAPGAGTLYTDAETKGWTLAAVGSYPVTEKVALMGKVGAAYLLTNARAVATGTGGTAAGSWEDDRYDPYYGLGVSYKLFDNMDLRAEWDRFDTDDTDIDLVTAGFAVRF